MVIQAGEYKLRSFNENDILSFYSVAHDELVKKYVPYAYPKDIEEAKELAFYYSRGDLKNDFYLVIQKEDIFIGMIIAVRTIEKSLDVSAFISKDFRGKGIMTIAMNSFIKWLHDNTDYEVLLMNINRENVASNHQIKKIGGVFKKIHGNDNIYEVSIR